MALLVGFACQINTDGTVASEYLKQDLGATHWSSRRKPIERIVFQRNE